MATIRDVVDALSRRAGVDAVVVVGRDGLPIDSRTGNGVDAENVAALVPAVINGMAQLGQAGGRGEFGTGVLEFGSGLAVVSVLNADALRSEEHTSELQSRLHLVCRLLLGKKKTYRTSTPVLAMADWGP